MMRRQIKNQADTKAMSLRRRSTRRSALEGGLAFGAGLTVGAFGIIGRASAAPITMRFGSDSPIGAPHTRSAVVMKELVESRTAGRVQVTIFPDGQLGANGPMTNSIKTGSLDALVTDLGHLSASVPEADVFNLPFLFRDLEQTLKFTNGPVGEQLKPKINEAFGCEVLGFTIDGSSDMWNGKRPIRTPADVVGLKMGVGTSKIQRDTILALGGIPTSLEINARYTALQSGLLDGTTNTPADVVELKLYQVMKYLTLTRHYSMPNALIVSKRFMDKLAPEDQAIVRAAGSPATDAHTEAAVKSEQENLALLQEKGLQIFMVENRKAFADKMEPVYKEAVGRMGADIIEQARRFVAT
jgi:tripartite ATP-independent transporter DctP family solute receptor